MKEKPKHKNDFPPAPRRPRLGAIAYLFLFLSTAWLIYNTTYQYHLGLFNIYIGAFLLVGVSFLIFARSRLVRFAEMILFGVCLWLSIMAGATWYPELWKVLLPLVILLVYGTALFWREWRTPAKAKQTAAAAEERSFEHLEMADEASAVPNDDTSSRNLQRMS